MSGANLLLPTRGVRRRSSSPIATTNSCTLDVASELNDLLIAMHRRSSGAPGAGPGGTLIDTQGNLSVFWELATAGQTVVQGAASPSVDRLGAIGYGGARLDATPNFAYTSIASGTTINWGDLVLEDPGHSWVAYFVVSASSGPVLNSISGAGPLASVVRTGDRVQMADTGGPVLTSTGVTGVMSAGGAANAWAVEIPAR